MAGFGLSYTTFTYGIASAPPASDVDAPLHLAPVRQLLADMKSANMSFPPLELSQNKEVAPAKYLVNVTNSERNILGGP
jgi:hypothetical protein